MRKLSECLPNLDELRETFFRPNKKSYALSSIVRNIIWHLVLCISFYAIVNWYKYSSSGAVDYILKTFASSCPFFPIQQKHVIFLARGTKYCSLLCCEISDSISSGQFFYVWNIIQWKSHGHCTSTPLHQFLRDWNRVWAKVDPYKGLHMTVEPAVLYLFTASIVSRLKTGKICKNLHLT